MTAAFEKDEFVINAGFLPRIAQADKSAAQECVDVYGAMIWTLAKQTVVSSDLAEKAVQEIFVDIWEKAAFCDPKISDEKVWIAMIAQRRLEKYTAQSVL